MNEFILMHKNTPVASISIIPNPMNKNLPELKGNAVFNNNMLPYGVKHYGGDMDDFDWLLNEWHDGRCIPLGRPNYDLLMAQHNILSNANLLSLSYMCSLTDVYWFKMPNQTISWEDVNFHQNGFSSNLYKHLFYGDNGEPLNHWNSPDVTTDGAMKKMWRQDNGQFVLYKGHDGDIPIEACYEVIANSIFDDLRIDHAPYWLVEDNGSILSACPCFIDSDQEEFVPAVNLIRNFRCRNQPELLELMRDWGFGESVDSMEFGDSLIGNIDRHARNYGVIIDADTHAIKRLAPLFDHGGSYLMNNHGHALYPPTDKTFNKTIQSMSAHALSLINYIDRKKTLQVINDLPIAETTKQTMSFNFNNRCDKIEKFIERDGYDLDRK
jgi:hypothetical protein